MKKPTDQSNKDWIDYFCDALWLEDGLSANTLDSYRRDLHSFMKWLENDVPVPRLEGFDRLKIPRDHRRWRQIRKIQHKQFFGIIAHPERVIHNQCLGHQTIQQVR